MDTPLHSHLYQALMQDMEPAFTGDKTYTLTSHEVEVTFLSLVRLKELEQACEKRDWETVMSMTPVEADAETASTAQPPRPLLARLLDLMREWQQQERYFDSAGNDMAACVTSACVLQLKKTCDAFIADVKAWRAAQPT